VTGSDAPRDLRLLPTLRVTPAKAGVHIPETPTFTGDTELDACPHQIINTGETTMRYLALSTRSEVDACEYPDSRKASIVTGHRADSGLRKMYRAETTFDYYGREPF
jgi:hypothetical protein